MSLVEHDIALLHTGEVHVASFTALMNELAPQLSVRHDVAEPLLTAAQAHGLTSGLARKIEAAMKSASDTGATVVMCTCSTIGGVAESATLHEGAQAMRIDRAMADRAVSVGGAVLVLAALESTLAPTRELLESSAARSGETLDATFQVIENAWPYFESGDRDAYIGAIAQHVQAHASDYDVIVLAQASMAAAAERCPSVSVEILSSPRLGIVSAIKAIRGQA